jgi:origin recognition complex subunit 1
MNRITFAPYSRQQLQQILDQRLNTVLSANLDSCGRSLFHPDALELCARKVAALSGDARRALQICRRAVEICESESSPMQSLESSAGKSLVEMKHIDRAVKELFSSPFTAFIQKSTFHEKMCLLGCLLESRMNSSNFISVARLYERCSNLCRSIHSGDIPQLHEFLRILRELSNSGLVVFENTGSGRGIGSDLGIGTLRTGREHGDELVTTSPILRLVVVHEDIIYSLHGDSQLVKFLPSND